jgi:hypothetical protein
MKRDPDLIRQILLAIEAKPDVVSLMSAKNINLPNWSEQEINYHLTLLVEAEYIHAIDNRYQGESHMNATRLTWKGHEFLDVARDNKRWEKAKAIMAQIGGLAFDVLKPVLTDMARNAVASSLGLSQS